MSCGGGRAGCTRPAISHACLLPTTGPPEASACADNTPAAAQIRILDCNGDGSVSDVIKALAWLQANATRPAIATMSLGGGSRVLLLGLLLLLHVRWVVRAWEFLLPALAYGCIAGAVLSPPPLLRPPPAQLASARPCVPPGGKHPD